MPSDTGNARTKVIVSRVTSGEHQQIKILAAKRGLSIDTYIRQALLAFRKQHYRQV